MEATNNTTLTTAAAWSQAIELTLSDIRRYARLAFELIKILFAFCYFGAAIIFALSEGEEIFLNVVGIAMIFIAYVTKKSN